MRLDPNAIRQQIENLKLLWPEAWEDGEDQLLLDMLEGETDMIKFLRRVEERRQEATHMAAGCASHIAELGCRLLRLEKREAAMRKIEFEVLDTAGRKKVELPIATLSIRNGQQKVVITDDTLIPDHLCKIERTPKKSDIKELLKSGGSLLGAELSNAEPYLAVTVR